MIKVRVHLNLAKPHMAESAIKIQSNNGWVTVAYSRHFVLQDAVPVIDESIRERVASGDLKKIPHAFLEGKLASLESLRIREKSPEYLRFRFLDAISELYRVDEIKQIKNKKEEVLINFNPKFSKSFYKDEPAKDMVSEKLVGAKYIEAIGWRYGAYKPELEPMTENDFCREAVSLTKFETSSLKRGNEETERLVVRSRAMKRQI